MQVVEYASSGGVVLDSGRVLLVRKRDVPEVRLPKGHINPGESRREAAVREVREETGYLAVQPVADLGTQLVEFEHEGRWIRRWESYFAMVLTNPTRGPRAPEEEAKFEVFWAPVEEALELLTFESERQFLRRALQRCPEKSCSPSCSPTKNPRHLIRSGG